MHRVVSSVTVGSIGDLGHIANALAAAHINIEAIGGGEARLRRSGIGVIAMLLNPDTDEQAILDALEGVQLDGGRVLDGATFHPSLDLVLKNDPGELGRAAALIGAQDVNIEAMVSVDVHGTWGVVALAFPSDSDRDTARDALVAAGFTVLDEHGAQTVRQWVTDQLDNALPPDIPPG